MKVLVVYCVPGADHQIEIDVPDGTTIEAAIRLCGLAERADEPGARPLLVGVWNRVVPLDQVVREGDRIEIYRPLAVDPKDGRRLRAESRRRRALSARKA